MSSLIVYCVGMYDVNLKECVECPYGCDKCYKNYTSDEIKCELCKSGMYIKNEVCVSDCGVGMYADVDTTSG